MSEFFAMGGHAWFVWSAYLLVLFVMGTIAIYPWWRLRRWIQKKHKEMPIE